MALRSVLRHRGVRYRTVVSGERIEGTVEEVRTTSPQFPCVVFPPGTREGGRSGRRNETPIMLYQGRDVNGAVLDLRADDRITITDISGNWDPEVSGDYQVDGTPQPLGKPGRRIKAVLVNLKQVKSGGA